MFRGKHYAPLGSPTAQTRRLGTFFWLLSFVFVVLICGGYLYIYSGIHNSGATQSPLSLVTSPHKYLYNYLSRAGSLDSESLKEQIANLYTKGVSSRHDLTLHARFGNLSNSELGINKVKPFDTYARFNIWDYFPPAISCPDLQRIGRVGDGGKWMCGLNWLKRKTKAPTTTPPAPLPPPPCVVYSFGISNDASFEEEILLSTECNVYAFDPSIGDLPTPQFVPHAQWLQWRNTRIFFFKQALGLVSGPSAEHMYSESLYDTMNRLNHSYVDILKVDVEGFEWKLFNHIMGLRSNGKPASASIPNSNNNIMKVINSNLDLLDVQWDDDNVDDLLFASLIKDPMVLFPFGQLLIELHYDSMENTRAFFELMRNFGQHSYSREINLQPCLEGSKPFASEYSFINPYLFFGDANHRSAGPSFDVNIYNLERHTYNVGSKIRQRDSNSISTSGYSASLSKSQSRKEARSSLLTSGWDKHSTGEKAVIYYLTQSTRVDLMKVALSTLYRYFWVEYPYYPVVIFHDDLTVGNMTALQSAVPNMHLTFIPISFSLPSHITRDSLPDRTVCSPTSSTIGYRHMCHFHSTGVHKELFERQQFRDVDYIMRLDDDGFFKGPIGYDLFKFMRVNNMKYAFPNVLMDDARCVIGLWNMTSDFVNRTLKGFNSSNIFYGELKNKERLTFYNNLEISHSSIWKHPNWKRFIGEVEKAGGIYRLRWGDAPIHTLGVSLVLKKSEMHAFSDIGYVHHPFVNQESRGLPMPGADLLVPRHAGCRFYKQWECGMNYTNSSSSQDGSSPAVLAKDMIGYASMVRRPWINQAMSVVYTFAHGDRERTTANTIREFYTNYARQSRSHFVIFYSNRGRFNSSKFLSALDDNEIAKLVKIIPAHLSEYSAVEYTSRSKRCGPNIDPEIRLAAEFMRFKAMDILKKLPISTPIGDISHSSAASLSTFSWFIRIADDSKFTSPPKYNAVDRMLSEGIKYGYVSMVREFQQCSDVVWDIAQTICEQLDTIGSSSTSKITPGSKPLGRCSGTIRDWPKGVVSFSNFEVSHASIWSSTPCAVLRNLAESWSSSSNSNSASSVLQNDAQIKSVADKVREMYKEAVSNSLFWSDSSVHTACMVMTINEKEMIRLDDFKYTFNIEILAESAMTNLSNGVDELGDSKLFNQRLNIDYLNGLFKPRRVGWLGGDVACSFALPNRLSDVKASGNRIVDTFNSKKKYTDYIWLFGDSLVGASTEQRRTSGHIISNTVAHLRFSSSKTVKIPVSSPSTPALPASKGAVQTKNTTSSGVSIRQVESLRFSWREPLDEPGIGSDSKIKNIEAIFSFDRQKLHNQSKEITLEDEVIFWPISGISLQQPSTSLNVEEVVERAFIMGPVIQHFDEAKLSHAFVVESSVAFAEKGVIVARVSNPRESADLWNYDYSLFPSIKEYEIRWTTLAAEEGLEACSSTDSCEWIYLLGFYSPSKKVSNMDYSLEVPGSHQILGRIRASHLMALSLEETEVLCESLSTSAAVDISSTNSSIASRISPSDSGANLLKKEGGRYNTLNPPKWMPLYKNNIYSRKLSSYKPYSLFGNRVTESSLHFNNKKKFWYSVSLQPPEELIRFCRTVSSAVEGPWRCRIMDRVSAPWNDYSKYITYAAKAHPEFLSGSDDNTDSDATSNNGDDKSGDDGILYSVITNTLNGFSDLYSEDNFLAYSPKFIHVKF